MDFNDFFDSNMNIGSLKELKELINSMDEETTSASVFKMKVEPDYETVNEIINEHLNLLKKEVDKMPDYITPYQLVDVVNVWIEDDFINSKLDNIRKDSPGIKSLFILVTTKEMSADMITTFNKNIVMNLLYDFTDSDERSIPKESLVDIIKKESDRIDVYLMRRLKVPEKLDPNN